MEAAEPDEEMDETIGQAEGAVINTNALNLNALNLNALNLNALNLNALNLNALNLNALGVEALSVLYDPGLSGDLARHAMQYIVSCALDSNDSFSFTWTDGAGVPHDESYPGHLGLAPHWLDGPLAPAEADWVSACLISRANLYGVSVQISSRGKHAALKHPDEAELSAFTRREGAFWGDLFSTSPVAYACHEPAEVSHARQAHRDCAAGHVGALGQVEDCGIIEIAGACDDLCTGIHAQYGYRKRCGTSPGAPDETKRVVTVFLQ
jgi:hypothetical protein